MIQLAYVIQGADITQAAQCSATGRVTFVSFCSLSLSGWLLSAGLPPFSCFHTLLMLEEPSVVAIQSWYVQIVNRFLYFQENNVQVSVFTDGLTHGILLKCSFISLPFCWSLHFCMEVSIFFCISLHGNARYMCIPTINIILWYQEMYFHVSLHTHCHSHGLT